MTSRYPLPNEPKGRIIFALDLPSFDEARAYIKTLQKHIGIFKIGQTLLMEEGFNVVRKIQKLTGKEGRFFIDIKLSDIPNTVAGVAAVITAHSSGIEFITVHLTEGEARVRESVKRFQTNGTKVLGVTVLTHMSDSDLQSEGSPFSAQEMVLKRAEIAQRTGCSGVVCSGREAQSIKKRFGEDFIVVTPGIRPAWFEAGEDDQQRVTTPGDAIRNGADYIVVGRPIYRSKKPVEAADRIAEEIAAALKERTRLS